MNYFSSKSIIKYCNLFLPFFVFISIFIIYVSTMLPSQGFFDHGELQTVVSTLDIAHPSGYPTYTLLGFIFVNIFRFGDMAWRVNLLSIIYTIGSFVCIYLFLNKLTRNNIFNMIPILSLAFVKPIWDHAGKADEHTLNLLFVFMLLYLFLLLSSSWSIRKWFLFCFLFGLGLGNHLLLIFTIPGFLVWFLVKIFQRKIGFSGRLFSTGFIGLVLGLTVYLFLPIRQMFGNSLVEDNLLTWKGFIGYVSGSVFHSQMLQGGSVVILKNTLAGFLLIKDYLPVPILFLSLIGIYIGLYFYTLELSVLLITFLFYIVFTTNFPTGDPERYYLEDLSFMVVFSAFAIDYFSNSIKEFLRKIKIKYVLIFTCCWILFSALLILPYYLFISNYKLVDKSRNYEAANWSREIFKTLLPGSIILSWWNYSTPFWYRQRVLHEREDVMIINKNKWEWKNYVANFIGKRPIFMIEYEPSIVSVYQVLPVGVIYHVLP